MIRALGASLSCSNGETPSGLLGESGHQNDQATITSLEFSVQHCPPNSPERGEGMEMELIIDATTSGRLYKIPKIQGSESFLAGEHNHTGRVTTPRLHGDRSSCLGTFPDLTLCPSSSGCPSASLSCLLINC